ncbi:enoyl-CoA hydratase/isomerase family protein [Variovorax sp.]|uniref:enoyl-CoA hydratase/isomerase family protein n=1 Tax=Variovorax sp. TaxID=1871043 RepID=UPI002D4E92BC|nr:enoyl-CoA hydratase-related protein [Variovorax sp.]HYP84162.1 enoyl-CoA hydratase-related protein [Variovorax sp.]
MTKTPLLTTIADGVMTLTLNRPDKLNAIDNDVAEALLMAIEAAGIDTTVRAVRVRGNGRAFCAGRDVGAAPTDRDLTLVQAVASALVRLDKPVLFAVHGWTIGAGLEWMLDADVVVAASNARFKLPEAALGVFVTGGLSATLQACAGPSRAKALTLLGEEFTPDEARTWGLVWRVVAPDELDEASMQMARRLAALDPAVARQFKRVFNDVGLANFDAAIKLENAAHAALGLSA